MTPPHLIRLKHDIYARIITPCAVYIVLEAFAVVFKRELLCFLHVGCFEHHAVAPVARFSE